MITHCLLCTEYTYVQSWCIHDKFEILSVSARISVTKYAMFDCGGRKQTI